MQSLTDTSLEHQNLLQTLKTKAQLPQEVEVPYPKLQKSKAASLANSGIHCTCAFAFVLTSLANKSSPQKQTAAHLAELLVTELRLRDSIHAEAASGHINFYDKSTKDSQAVSRVTQSSNGLSQPSLEIPERRHSHLGKLLP